MKLLVAGDTHGNLPHIRYLIRVAHEQSADAIVQVGDFGYTWPGDGSRFETLEALLAEANLPMLFLDGNHDNFTDLIERGAYEADAPCPISDHVTYLPRGCVWDWNGVRFMSLGGAVSIDKARRIKGLSWWPEETVSPEEEERAIAVGKVDVLFTHDAPTGVRPLQKFLDLESSRLGVGYKVDALSSAHRDTLRRVCDSARPELLIHGHYHHRYAATAPWAEDGIVIGLDRDTRGTLSWVLLNTDDYDGGAPTLLADALSGARR